MHMPKLICHDLHLLLGGGDTLINWQSSLKDLQMQKIVTFPFLHAVNVKGTARQDQNRLEGCTVYGWTLTVIALG
jgi:hypothetical protein